MPANINLHIKPNKLRQSGGGRILNYIPQIFPNGDFHFPNRSFSIYQIKYGGKTRGNTLNKKKLLFKRHNFLSTHYGLSRNNAKIFLSRPSGQIERIEETIHGIFDSILLFDHMIFCEDRPSMINIVRNIIIIGSYNLKLVISYWKEFTTFLYNRAARFQEKLPTPSSHNFFFKSLKERTKKYFDGSDLTKSDLEKFAHLTSTRQLPAADKKVEKESLLSFKKNIEEHYEITFENLEDLRQTSKLIGQFCQRHKKPITFAHISLGCAGSYAKTVLQGGRGQEIKEILEQYLLYTPEEDENISTPYGNLICPKGAKRWRYWTRSEPYLTYPEIDFGKVLPEEFFSIGDKKCNLYYQGYDEAIGPQIISVAFLEYLKHGDKPIPCRVLTIPEPGYKSRIVTTGPFWLNILQQGLSHILKDKLKSHPSVVSSLTKSDQAWQAMYRFSQKEFPEDFWVLSSDLKEATDHIPKVIGRVLLESFLEGLGSDSRHADVCLSLISRSRQFEGKDHEILSINQERGIMMGEPLTKVILTILNLVVEEEAFRWKHKGHCPYKKWRSYHIGGDDHIACGPKDYLERITYNHIRWGSVISKGKHGLSKVLVKYCEKVIDVRNLLKGFNIFDTNNSTEGYRNSPFVDSVKVRLLSPTSKSFDVISDRNIAIGKGISLGNTLKWLNRDHFSIKWVKMVRSRFFARMGSLLPNDTSSVYWQLHLPVHLGGLGLYVDDEVDELYNKIPRATHSVMVNILRDPDDRKPLEILSNFLSNCSYRGFVLNETEVGMIKSQVETVIEQLPSLDWKGVKAEFDPSGEKSAVELVSEAHSNGYLSRQECLDYMLRPILFKEILLGIARPSAYNTEPLKRRYAKIWDLYNTDEKPTLEEFRDFVKNRPKDKFYKVEYPPEFHFYSDRNYLFKSAIDDALNGMPNLAIPNNWL